MLITGLIKLLGVIFLRSDPPFSQTKPKVSRDFAPRPLARFLILVFRGLDLENQLDTFILNYG